MVDKVEEKIDRIEKAVAENTQGIKQLTTTVDGLAGTVAQTQSDVKDLIEIVVPSL